MIKNKYNQLINLDRNPKKGNYKLSKTTSNHLVTELLNRLITLLELGAFDCADESTCQNQIEIHLTQLGVSFIREYPLKNGIVDFFFPKSGIALEIKASKKWGKLKVYRQCEKYCVENNVVKGLLLATATAMSLPETIGGKPVAILSLSAGNL
jgi:hypothetical protein